MGKRRPALLTAEPLKAGACGFGGWCQGTWPRGGRALPGLRGAARDGAWGFEDTGALLGVCKGSPPTGFGPSRV